MKKQVVLTGDRLTDAQPGFDSQTREPAVHLTLDAPGARIFRDVTRENIGKRMAILLIEKGKGEVVTAPVIRIGDRRRPRADLRPHDHRPRPTTRRCCCAPARSPRRWKSSRSAPSARAWARDNIEKGFNSTIWGFLAIAVFMMRLLHAVRPVLGRSRWPPTCCFLVAMLSLLQATLTLPGIAAIALTLGMAIDANVLINERIREELRNGATPQAAIARRLRTRLRHHPRLQHHHADRRPRAAHLRLRPGARLRGGALPRHPDLDLLVGGGVARDRQPDFYGNRRKLERVAIGNTSWK